MKKITTLNHIYIYYNFRVVEKKKKTYIFEVKKNYTKIVKLFSILVKKN